MRSRAHLGAQVALGCHVVCAVQIGVIISLRAPADLAHQAELQFVDGAEHELLLEEADWVRNCALDLGGQPAYVSENDMATRGLRPT